MTGSVLYSRVPALWLAGLLACGCATLPTPEIPPSPVEALTVDHPSGLKVTTRPLPTPDLVYLSLWIDAGSRDAEVPQTATAAALLAAAAAGEEVVARVLPDGTELGRRCSASAIDSCLEELTRGLALRSASPEQIAAASAEIRRRRARALADEARATDRLALRALLGEEAEGFFPLGRVEGDTELSGASVERFLADHYGPGRSHLVVVGDVDEERVAAEAARQLGGLPSAAARRRVAEGISAEGGLEFEVGTSSHAAIAMVLPDGAHARAAARRLLEPTAPALPGRTQWVRAFEVRGGGLLIAGALGGNPAELVRGMSWAGLRMAASNSAEVGDRSGGGPTQALASARAIGRRWASGSARGELSGIGVGVVVPGGRGDRLDSDDPDADTRRRARTELESALVEGRALASPETEALELEGGAAMRLENGSRVSVLQRPADTRFAVALKIVGGASEEPARLHGVTALLGELIAAECRALLASIDGAQVGVFVEDEAWGLVASGPIESHQQTLEGLLRCGLHPAIHENEIEDARLELLTATGRVGADRWLSNLGAAVVAPERPGLVAPLGSHDGLLRVRRTDLVHARDRMLVGRRVELAAVGPVDADAVARRAASLLAPLTRGEPAEVADVPRSSAGLVAARWDREDTWVLIAWRSDSPDPAGASSRAFAAEAGRALRAVGLPPTWSDGGGGLWGSWAVVTVAVPEGDLDALPSRVASVRVPLEALEAATRRDDEARRWRSADPRHAALDLLSERPDLESTQEVLRGLSSADAAYVIIRDQSGPAFEHPAGDPRRAAR